MRCDTGGVGAVEIDAGEAVALRVAVADPDLRPTCPHGDLSPDGLHAHAAENGPTKVVVRAIRRVDGESLGEATISLALCMRAGTDVADPQNACGVAAAIGASLPGARSRGHGCPARSLALVRIKAITMFP